MGILNLFNKKRTANALERAANPLTREIAVRQAVTGAINNFLNALPDPDPVLRKLGKPSAVLEDLLADDHVFSVVTRRKNGVKRLDWQFAADEDAQKELEFVRAVFEELSERNKIGDLISQALNPILFGYAVFEITWKKAGKYLIPHKVEEKPRDWFGFDAKGELFYQGEFGKERIYITGENAAPYMQNKFVILRNEPTYDNPYGVRTLSRVFWPVTFKRGGLKFWAVFVEKYGMPYMFGKLPRGAGEDAHKDLLEKLEAMVADGIGTMPDDSSVEALDVAKGSKGEVYDVFLEKMDNAISKAVLTNTLSTELDGEGSRAATETHRSAELSLADMDKYFVIDFFKSVIKRLIDINFGSGKYPYFIDVKPQSANKETAERDKTLSETGVKFSKNYYLKTYGFDEEDIEEITVAPDEPKNVSEFAEASEQNRKYPRGVPRTFEYFSDAELQKQIEQTLKPVLTLVKNGGSYEEIMERLAETFPEMRTDALERALEKLIFIAELEGATKSDKGKE